MTRAEADAINEVVTAIQAVIDSPAYQRQVLATAPAIARHVVTPRGVCTSYDFHLTADGPQLIEINTNAGGLLLNGLAARAERACCPALEYAFALTADPERLDDAVLAMFLHEWRRARGLRALESIAIIDSTPQAQFLYPEFIMFARLFARAGITTVITDAADLRWRDGRLWQADTPIDLIYNRSTDFYFDLPAHAALRAAYLADAVVATPHPRAHALYADKRRLTLLSDQTALERVGVDRATQQRLLASIPRTVAVTAGDAQRWWRARRDFFFKPVCGFGSQAAYRGDKLARRVLAEIAAGGYVAQTLVKPSLRRIEFADQVTEYKVDVRAYTYDGQVQLLAARFYQGQTTNFRTPGGGFAPVFVATGATGSSDDAARTE